MTARSYQRHPVLAKTVPESGPVQAIARVRLAPDKPCPAFEWQLRAIPAVLSAVHVIGDVDYELRLACPGVADLATVLTSLRGCGGVNVALPGCGVPIVGLACELRRCQGPAVGHHDHPCPCACSI